MRTLLAGTLTVGGARKEVAIDADLLPAAGNALRVKGSYDFRMTEYGLKPPSLMLGTLKVNELVKVNFDLVLKD
jgi:polyisoprenoid-binding protein YceI